MSRGCDCTINVLATQVGKIIGRGGCKIREIEQDSGARVKISRDEHEPGMKSVDIMGSQDQVDKAKYMIEECTQNDYNDDRRGGSNSYGDDYGRRRDRGPYSGYSGRRDDYNSRRDDRGGGWGGRRDDGGDQWSRDDFQRGGGGGGRRGFANDVDDSIFVDSLSVGRIIGRGGSRIRDLEKESGCRIKVSKESDEQGRCMVSIGGGLEQVAEAKRLIGDCL